MQNTEDKMEHPEENKSQREHIASIYKEYTTPSRVLRSFTNLANTVIQTALSGQSKFVFEILQNADDAYEDQNKSIEIKFILQDNYLLVNHNGKGFDFNDVERICDYASQIEEVKATDLRKTGYKGLGFKSLFNLSDCIYIHSNGYTFRFDKGHWPDPESKPWQVIPIWCEYDELPLNQNNPYDEPVNLILKVNDVTHLASQLRELVDQPELLLYLFRINKLNVSFKEEKHFLERRTEKFGVFNKIDFYKNQQVESTWLSKDYTQPVPTEVQTVVRGASRFVYPDRIRNANEMLFTFALRSNETLSEISNITGICYSTLPTQLDLTLPYHINSLFILNLDRTQLHENEWNEFLVEQLGYLQFKLLKDLAALEYLKNYVIRLFVRQIYHPYEKFSKAFLKGFMSAKGEIGWLPSHQGDRLLKLGQVWTDETKFFKQDFQNIQNNEIIPYLINYEVKCQEGLSTTEAKHFTYEILFRDFPNLYYHQLTKDSYLNFINYLYERIKGTNNLTKLTNVPFLVAKDGTLLKPVNALLEETPIPNFFNLNPIDNECLPSNNIVLIKNWLTLLGARRLSTPIQVLRESVLKWIDYGDLNKRINTGNHIVIMNYLAKGVTELTHNETEKLKVNLHILTQSNQFKLAKSCYFPDAVCVKELSITSDDETISSSYDLNNLKNLFILVGVVDIVNPIDVLRKGILMWIGNGKINNKITISNYASIIKFLASNYFKFIYDLSEAEKNQLKKMPILTCGQTFQTAQDCYFESAVPKIKGFECLVPSNRMVPTNYSDCVTDFLTHIGVSKSIAPIDVIRKSILKWIQEGDIFKRITMDNHQDILKYIGEHWNVLPLQKKEKEDLKKMSILTCGQTFQMAKNCYFKSAVPKIKGLEDIIPISSLVSTDYSNSVTEFLTKIGVSKSMTPIDVMQRSILKWIQEDDIFNRITMDNHQDILKYISEHWTILDSGLKTQEKEMLKKMPILMCDQTFQTAQDCYFESAVPKIKGLEDLVPSNRMVPVNYSPSVTDFLTKIGVSKSMTSIDVIRKSIFKWIQEDDIFNRITMDNHQDILKYISEHWTILDSGLQAKEKEVLEKMPILTESGVFRVADNCYSNLSGSKFEEIPGLKSIITSDELVYSGYQSKIKNLLKYIGVHNLGFTDIYQKYSDNLNCKSNVKWFFSQLVDYWEKNKANKDQLLSCLRQKFRDSPCLLAKNNKMYSSTEIYSSRFYNICDIDVNTLLVLQYERLLSLSLLNNQSLPDDLEKYLGFKTDLDITCIKKLLEAIGKKPDLGKNKTKMFFITILEQLRKKDKTEVVKAQLSLLALDNKLKLAKDLNYFTEKDATCSLESCYLKRIFGMSHEDTLELARLCGVNAIPFQQEIIRENETRDESLKDFYLERLPFIAIQESKMLYEDITSTLKSLYEAICSIELYLCHNIQVKYPFGDISNVQHHFEGLTLYVDDEWDNKRSTIHDYLKEKLDLKSDIRSILDMRQPKTQKNKEYWLSSQNQDPKEFYFVEEKLKEFMSNNGNGQSDILTTVEILKNNQDQNSEHEDINFIDNSEELAYVGSLLDETTPSDETFPDNEFVQNDTAHHFEHDDGYFKDGNQDLLDVRSPPDASFTEHLLNEDDLHLKKKNTFERKSKQVFETSESSTDIGNELLNWNGQSDRAVRILQEDRVHHSEHNDRNLEELIDMRSLSVESLTDYISDEEESNLQTENVSEHESQQECGKRKFHSDEQKDYEPHEASSGLFVGGYITTVGTELKFSSKIETVHYANTTYLQKKNSVKRESSKVCSTRSDNLKIPDTCEGTFADKLKLSAPLQDITESVIDEDNNIRFDTILLIPMKFKTSRIKWIPQTEISTEVLHTGSSRCLPEVSGEKSDIIWLSEKYVFTCLQEQYTKKYPTAEYNLSDGIFTIQWQSKKIEIVWLNASGEKGQSYDIVLKKEGVVKRLIEVKSEKI